MTRLNWFPRLLTVFPDVACCTYNHPFIQDTDDVREFSCWLCLVKFADLIDFKVSGISKKHKREEWVPKGFDEWIEDSVIVWSLSRSTPERLSLKLCANFSQSVRE